MSSAPVLSARSAANQPVSYAFDQLLQSKAPKEEDQDKFISDTNVTATKATEIRKKMEMVKAEVATHSASFDQISKGLAFRTVKAEEIRTIPTKLGQIKVELAKQGVILHGSQNVGGINVGGIDKEVASVAERESIPQITQSLQELEFELARFKKSTKRLAALCESPTFQGAYARLKESKDVLWRLVGAGSSISEKIAHLQKLFDRYKAEIFTPDEVIPAADKKAKKRAIIQCDLEVLCVLKQAANQLKTKCQGGDEPAKLAAIILKVDQRAQEIQQLLASIPKKAAAPQVAQAVSDDDQQMAQAVSDDDQQMAQAVSDAEQKKYAVYDKPFWFWTNTHTLDRKSFQSGYYYQDTGALGEELEAKVAQRCLGLMNAVQKRLSELCKGDIGLRGSYASVDDELDHYKNVLTALQTTFVTLRAKIVDIPLDRVAATRLIDYVNAVAESLTEVGRMLKYARQFAKRENVALFKAQAELFSLINSENLSPIRSLRSLQEAERLYQAANVLRHAGVSQQRQDGIVDKSMRQNREILTRIHAKHDASILALSDEEKSTWDTLLGLEDIESLRYQGEPTSELPVTVKAFIVKQITRKLFLPAEAHDGELELLLHLLKTHERYKPLYEASLKTDPFSEIIGAYEGRYGNNRLTPQRLESVCKIVRHTLGAATSKRDHLAYAKAWQRYFEFESLSPFKEFCALMKMKLEEIAKAKNYVLLPQKSQILDFDAWRTDAPELFIANLEFDAKAIMQPDQSLEQLKKLQLHGFLMRALSCAIFSKSEVQRRKAIETISDIMEKDEYQPLRGELPEDIMWMLYENTINILLKGVHEVRPNQLKLFLDGPVNEFLSSERIGLTGNKVQHALYCLVLREKEKPETERPITRSFIDAKGERRFERWFTDYQTLIAGTRVSRKLFQLIQEERDRQAVATEPRKLFTANDWMQHYKTHVRDDQSRQEFFSRIEEELVKSMSETVALRGRLLALQGGVA